MSQRPIQFWFRGRLTEVRDVSPQRTVLQWLREDIHATGSKEGCGEGDCGACTVVIGSRDDSARGGVRLEAVNSCIQLLPTLDGKALFTVEDLARADQLHPLQQAMVETHASQCGFCTPGFVMSLWADYESRDAAPTRDEIAGCLSGNLCRCTGYRPIIDAAQQAWQQPACKMDRQPLRATLDTLAAMPALDYQSHGQRFIAPRSIAELARHCEAMPQARLLAGSTDIGLWVTKQLRQLGDIIYLGALEELKAIVRQDDCTEIGAGASLSSAFSALTQDEPHWQELAQRFASLPVRNAGTLGGNVANGSPIGDSMPGLIALGTQIVLQKGEQLRSMALEDFYLAYQKTALAPGEFVRALRIPRAVPGRLFRSWKVSKRQDQDISAVCAGFALTLGDAGRITSARLAFGGMAATPRRASAAEAALLGQPFELRSVEAAMAALDTDFQPLDDMRASAAYRLMVARNLLRRLWLEHSNNAPLRIAEVSA
ncbi:xanthine dehydrogenase small subunit [Uliginosibacterium sp. 31-16]|uniref:xanthine dehydrogenase small subunit n=1 Tax=Uliginosibacterium sp. 31-16 TaxID=3068315 RepID=UPI00273D80A7|nr:xanthine dehydrogenase small subunit [Uliginosibacterium sp. 31-16]MDP5238318.1 xanthine dehydrogenase small subunit [Uliginosibacterium sp. 31-16]